MDKGRRMDGGTRVAARALRKPSASVLGNDELRFRQFQSNKPNPILTWVPRDPPALAAGRRAVHWLCGVRYGWWASHACLPVLVARRPSQHIIASSYPSTHSLILPANTTQEPASQTNEAAVCHPSLSRFQHCLARIVTSSLPCSSPSKPLTFLSQSHFRSGLGRLRGPLSLPNH